VVADWLARLEARLSDDDDGAELAVALVSLAYAAGQDVDLDADELRAAGRRALLLLATGGDPGRGLDLDGRAVRAFAAELDTRGRRATLATGIDGLRRQARGHPHVSEALRALAAEPEIAWRAFAAALLAEELEGEDGADPAT
jgi:hypothetical protein